MAHLKETLRLCSGSRGPMQPDELAAELWNGDIGPGQYSGDAERYQTAILEQYKMYVEMADRISARRSVANSFFLTLNTVILTLIGALWRSGPHAAVDLLVLPLVGLLGLCLVWFWLVRSYRQLTWGKLAVIGALERRLPASPYWGAEWEALGKGGDKASYWPLSRLEQWIPCWFAVAYIGGFFATIVH